MQDNQGFEILINGTPRTFRDHQQPALEAARIIKKKNRSELVEVLDRSTGTRVVVLEDGRTQ